MRIRVLHLLLLFLAALPSGPLVAVQASGSAAVGAEMAVLPGAASPRIGYWSWDEVRAQLQSYRSSRPYLVHVESIGESWEGRDIPAVRIASPRALEDLDAPEILFMAGIHPREQAPQVALMEFLDELVSGYGADERITRLLDTRRVWFIPVLNVDGKVHDVDHAGPGAPGANWRVSRRPLENGEYGVDLNRNGAVGWGGGSPNPGTATYHGEGPISEPETRALYDFLEARGFRVYLDIHSSLERYLLPGHLIREEARRYRRLVEGLQARQAEPYAGGPRMKETQASAQLGTGAGQTHATGFYLHGAYSIVYEIGPPGEEARFYPGLEEILAHYRENVREPWFFLLEEAGRLPPVRSGHVRLVGYELDGTPIPGGRVGILPSVHGDAAYGVLVSASSGAQVTADYRLYPLGDRGHVLRLSPDVVPGTELPFRLYVWDRDRRRSILEFTVTVGEPAERTDAGNGASGG
ncbi:MAG: M14 family zinc carboxypeptidase [Gemmatimonadota bacterium]